MNRLADEIARLRVGAIGKSVNELTEQERLAIAISAGCEVEFTDTGIRLKNPVSIIQQGKTFSVIEGKR